MIKVVCGIVAGALIGAVLGRVAHDTSVGIAMCIALGAVAGYAWERWDRRRDSA